MWIFDIKMKICEYFLAKILIAQVIDEHEGEVGADAVAVVMTSDAKTAHMRTKAPLIG